MPHPGIASLYERAVWWKATGVDRYGQPTIAAPVEIAVRWNDAKREVLGPQGNTIAVDATAITDRDVTVNSLMWLGRLDDWYASGSAGPDLGDGIGLMEVKSSNATADQKNRARTRTVGLIRYKNKLPAFS